MRRLVIHISLLLSLLFVAERATAQYYSWGVDPVSFRWKQMKGENYRVVYPDTAQHIAHRMMHYLDAVNKDIAYGYRHPQMSIPFVVHPANARSNGLVMWMPRRVEFLSTPGVDGYSMPWLKSLVAHEYRHAVQYNNLNRGVVKALSYVLGQQSSTIGLLFMPLWMMEGDAVMIETEMSTYGRGRQPSFSIGYRGYESILADTRNRDKWFCGSFRQYIPDHYALGYLLSRHAYNRFGRVIGDDVAELSSRRPYMVVSTAWRLNKLYGCSDSQLFDSAFRELEARWTTLADVEPSAEPIAVPEVKSHTTYEHPLQLADGRILALKSDFDKPMAFVEIDTAGNERRVLYTGRVSTRPALSTTGKVWWTEYKRSRLFQEMVLSELWCLDVATGKYDNMPSDVSVLYPTPTEGHGIAWVEYTPDGEYSVVINGPSAVGNRVTIPFGSEVHDMAWDDKTEALYLIITDDDGMHIARLRSDGIEAVTKPAYITLSHLRAKNGRLYYGSIATGKDELHCFDIASGEEYCISQSHFGSFSPTPVSDDEVVATSYDHRGYMPVRQRVKLDSVQPYRLHPPHLVIPEGNRWNVVNLDTVRFSEDMAERIEQQTPPKRFSRLGHAFNIHSWAPLSYDPYALVEESSISFNLGATLMSQNITSTMEGFLTWGWNMSEGSVFKGMLRYYGLGVNLWASGTYGGSQNVYKVYVYNPETEKLEFPAEPSRDKYFSVTLGATLPLLFERGYHTRQLTVSTSWNYSNGMVANVDKLIIENGKVTNLSTIGYSKGVHLLNFGVSFQDVVRMSHRDFLPPWGVALSANYAQNPAEECFGHLVVAYGKLYLPGFAKHHSLSLAASYQTSIGGFQSDFLLSDMALKSTRLLPRGFSSYDISNNNYVATSLNYQLPIWYPDGGWEGVIFFKRLRLNIGGDYASFRRSIVDTSGKVLRRRAHIGSYGFDLGVDFNIIRMPSSATISANFSLYRKVSYDPRANGKLYFSFGLGLPF